MQARPNPLVVGVLNVTPDSFSDGGRFYAKGLALQRAEEILAEGADIIDVGGESTRPGSAPVGLQEEMDRVLPVVESIASTLDICISVDTRKFELAKEAVSLGAKIINDISGGADIRLVELVRDNPIRLILMHMQGTPETMQAAPSYPRGVVTEVSEFLQQRVRSFEEAGIARERLWVDPGIGFGKTLEQNLELLKNANQFVGFASRVMVGTSRKSFLARLLANPDLPFEQRESGTLASHLWCYAQGVSVFRVHDVGAMKRALVTWNAIQNAG